MQRAFTLLTSTTTWEKRLAKSGMYFCKERYGKEMPLNCLKSNTKCENESAKTVCSCLLLENMLLTNNTTYNISSIVKPQETHEKVDMIAMGYHLFTYINIIL